MTTERDAVKKKIKNLLDRGTRTTSQAEAATAMKFAMKLMEEWSLTVEDVELADADIVKIEIGTGKKTRHELDRCAVALADFCSTKVWVSTKYNGFNKQEGVIHVLGYQEDVDLFEYFWNVISNVFNAEFAAYKKTDEYALATSYAHGRIVRADFRNGFVRSVNDTLNNLSAEREQHTTKNGTALVPLKMANIDDYATEVLHLRLRKSVRSYSGGSGFGSRAGANAGARVNFNGGISGSTSRTKLLS